MECNGKGLTPSRAFPSPKESKLSWIVIFQKQAKPNLNKVKQFLDSKYNTSVCLGTIHNHASGTHQNARKGHEAQQLLSPV
jgi:hypothetical protein